MKFDLNWAALMARGNFAGRTPRTDSRIADSDDEYPPKSSIFRPGPRMHPGLREALTLLTFINQRARQGLPPVERWQAHQRVSLPQPYDHTRYWSFFHAADLHAGDEEALCSGQSDQRRRR
jgi:hypothetical protein